MTQQTTPLRYSPTRGATFLNGRRPFGSSAADYRDKYPDNTWTFNPWTGEARSGEDIVNDPQGHAIVPPGEEVMAAGELPAEPSTQPIAFAVDREPFSRPSSVKDSNPKDAIADSKLPLHLISPIVACYQAIAHWLGNIKYGAWNFRAAGARASVYYAATRRHLDAWWEGQENDPTDGTPHLANALACIDIIIDAKHSGKLTDDRPPSRADELVKVRAEFEALMPKLREQYADRNPKHYTINDHEARPAERVVKTRELTPEEEAARFGRN